MTVTMTAALVGLGGFSRWSMGVCQRPENRSRVYRANLAFWLSFGLIATWPLLGSIAA